MCADRTMSRFVGPLILGDTDRPDFRQVHKTFSYYSTIAKAWIIVPHGFITDGATIPRVFWSWIGHPWGKYRQAAVLHDFLYATAVYTQKLSDSVFLEAMQVLRVGWVRRHVMFAVVRSFGWIAWRRHRIREVRESTASSE